MIQFPVESDFREAWRYRDWVVDAHNRDLPYGEFMRLQIAGDLLQPKDPEQVDTDALVATGLLAIADFVPGDVDKDQMIADYVNDQIDVVGRAFLGLTLGCARCHDHKFDPISIQDYYALAGIFFSTRLIPSPVLGNTPLVRVPLLPRAEVERIEARKKRAGDLEEQTRRLKIEADWEYMTHLERLATEQTARYLLASRQFKNQVGAPSEIGLSDFARTSHLHPKILAQWLDYFGLRNYKPCTSLSRNEDEVIGLHRWSSGTNHPPAIRVNARGESVAHKGLTLPARSLSLTPSKTSGIVISCTSPFNGTARLTGRVTDMKAPGSKGFTAALDLRTSSGRREIASFHVDSGAALELSSLPNPNRLGNIVVRTGDSIEFIVLPQTDSTSTAVLDWTIVEVGGERAWSATSDLGHEPEKGDHGNAHADSHRNPDVWHFLETGDIRRPASEAASGNDAWTPWRQALREADGKSLDESSVGSAAGNVESAFVAIRRQQATEADIPPLGELSQLRAETLKLRANDTRLLTSGDGRVAFWPNRARSTAKFATVAPSATGPLRTNVIIGGRSRAVLRFDGNELLEVPQSVPPAGSLFLVFRFADKAASGQRLIGWEDARGGRHGIGLMSQTGSGLNAILRKDGANGDILAPPVTNSNFEIVSLTWGSQGATLYRQGVAVGNSRLLDGVSSDPEIKNLRLGGPGSGSGEKFRGDLAEVRVYTQPLEDASRAKVEQELFDAWLNPDAKEATPLSAIELVYDELCSPRGPFWLNDGEREGVIDSKFTPRISQIHGELDALNKSLQTNVPQAVVVLEGGPVSTKHEGFKDAHIFLRGNPANPGAIVPRGFPRVLAGDHQSPITEGSGRLRLADWIASATNPLTARVAVNRIWQHHFGQGIVRTSTNFGRRGERPTHPELLDYLASRFIESGGSFKAMHRLMMLSEVYQQQSGASSEALARDPENFLLSRMNRTSLDAESLRDSMLVVAGQLDMRRGGVGFQDVALPRRSLYLMSVRTGAKSGFASIFDGPDSSAIVEKRSTSTVAPQALFLLNDPFTVDQARLLARRVSHQSAASKPDEQIRGAYRLVFGRRPTVDEDDIGRTLFREAGPGDPLERLCQILLCSNEFFYVD
ncbi:MAG: DUF1553 domain-containing protein [Pedosphaera sp.]|nr:DUF1553 domain-containing protein [Pedosphaera sp.]